MFTIIINIMKKKKKKKIIVEDITQLCACTDIYSLRQPQHPRLRPTWWSLVEAFDLCGAAEVRV